MNPSPWITRFGPLVPADGAVLDVACGPGRHTRWFRQRGYDVVAVDRDLSRVEDLMDDPHVELVQADLEIGAPAPWTGRTFAAVVVTNYLWRPLLAGLVAAVAPDGWFLYETFAVGNERFGRPSNPDFLLRAGELLDVVRGNLTVVAYEALIVDEPKPAAIQHVAATRVQHLLD